MEETFVQTLTIAGSDSGGGAGIQADLKTFQMRGVFGTSVLTAVTAQNTLGVSAVHLIPTDIITAQIEAVRSDFERQIPQNLNLTLTFYVLQNSDNDSQGS